MKRTYGLMRLGMILIVGAFASGCSFEEGWRTGVSDGVNAALSALIEAPVNAFIDQVFAGG